ncbi:MAG: GntR family transcriptional regulator [Defluviitaleaceae bacterium]|nr:GntR family transcriptional regulator [Defluviitaleaceae bacterium]
MQIIGQFKLLVLQGRLKNGDEIPSRRMIAAQLAVNPNTVQKAFAELEKDGLIATPPNAKSVVFVNEAALERLRVELLEGQAAALVAAAKGAGLSRGQLVSLICAGWDG